ncbi:MAG: hypothetical protein U9O24_10495 [Campylobacterota bacterium]|nr:hypothetical protein [Campylobacterota bacterium]
MKQKFFTILLLTQVLFAELKVGEKFPNVVLNDQFDKKATINTKDKIVIMTFEKSTAHAVTEYLEKKPGKFISKHKVKYIADVSSVPSLLFPVFALPKMKKYPFSVLLIRDDFGKIFNQKEEKVTLYKIVNKKIEEIIFLSPEAFPKFF